MAGISEGRGHLSNQISVLYMTAVWRRRMRQYGESKFMTVPVILPTIVFLDIVDGVFFLMCLDSVERKVG